MKRAAKHFTHIQMVGEMIARPENRIELSSDKDELGLPLSKMTMSCTDNERALYTHASPGHSRPKDGVASARLCPGHPRLAAFNPKETWIAGTSPAMTESAGIITFGGG
jgi:hypothetical protein